MVPSLSTSLGIVSGPGALPRLRNLTNLMRVGVSTSATSSCSFPTSNQSSDIWVLRRIKISMIILNKFVDIMEVIRIKVVAFYAKVFHNRFGKKLRFVSVSLGDFVW